MTEEMIRALKRPLKEAGRAGQQLDGSVGVTRRGVPACGCSRTHVAILSSPSHALAFVACCNGDDGC
jgi:hypothetical protein